MKADSIAFHGTIISGQGQNVYPQAIGFEFFDESLSANLPTNLRQMAYVESLVYSSIALNCLRRKEAEQCLIRRYYVRAWIATMLHSIVWHQLVLTVPLQIRYGLV